MRYFFLVIGPLLAITCCLPIAMLLWYTNTTLDGSFLRLWNNHAIFDLIYSLWRPYLFGTATGWGMLVVFILSAFCLITFLPGRKFKKGPMASDGSPLISTANGFSAFLILIASFLLCAYPLQLFSATIIYDHFPGLLGALNLFSLLFYVCLRLKEKYLPKARNINMYTICRFAMMGWGLILLSFAAKQQELYGLKDAMCVAVALQLVYIMKFFWWEIGYLRSMDITYDRAGFLICWGCIFWLPAIYTSPTLYLTHHPHSLGTPAACALFTAGIACILINYLIDRQRHDVRSVQGDCLVWRRKPEVIFANYRTEWGEEKQSLLLASGWWGLSRHFHYIPELLGAFFWSAAAGFAHFLPYFYLSFLSLLLIDRAWRHERRCARKYGKDWEAYCTKVPFRIIPFIY